MSEASLTPFRGAEEGHDWFVPAVYAVSVLCLVVLLVLLGGSVGEAIYGGLLPWLLVATPPPVAAINGVRGGGLPESVAIGATPLLAFALLGWGTLTVGTLSRIAAVCLGGSLTGYVAGYAVRELYRLYYEG